ncbi:hypothetical protein BHE74_00006752 [Ensete ventricosum]|nr:hypothetical protein BHE74_00006752 [Ensete ventricosum]
MCAGPSQGSQGLEEAEEMITRRDAETPEVQDREHLWAKDLQADLGQGVYCFLAPARSRKAHERTSRSGSSKVERFRERPRQPLPRHIPFSASMDSRGVEAGMNPADGRRPDIYELFCHYNALYFRDALGTCALSWASSSPYPR